LAKNGPYHTGSGLLLISGVLLTLRNPDDYQPSRTQIAEEKVASRMSVQAPNRVHCPTYLHQLKLIFLPS
jgi:hypothetical protein